MPEAMQLLQADLDRYCPDVTAVVGTAGSVVGAAKVIRQQAPDILFLDIALSDGTGFDLLEILPELSSNVIFITAYEEHALRAFRYSATDYLLKPIDSNMLKSAVDKVKHARFNSLPALTYFVNQLKIPARPPTEFHCAPWINT